MTRFFTKTNGRLLRPYLLGMALLASTGVVQGQTADQLLQIKLATPSEALENLAREYAKITPIRKASALAKAKQLGWPLTFADAKGKVVNHLVDLDELGNPVYAGVDNLSSAQTLGIDKVWPGGTTNYNLTGRGYKASQWDAGSPVLNHVELIGRVVSADGSGVDDHSTHTAGTILGKGVSAEAKGMAYEATMRAYNTSSPINQMANEANNGSLAGNHSWSYKRGFQPGGVGYVWLGPATAYVDPGYGYYSNIAAQWDAAALNMPYFLNCKSAGNDRGSGPAPGQTYTIQATGATVTQPAVGSATYRAPNGQYDCMANHTVSKNLLSVAAVSAIRAGYTTPNGVIMSSFSSWGPTDDGRIKPDISAVGVSVYSSVGPTNTSYDTYDGTSMSTPSMTGVCLLLQEQHANTHQGRLMRAETLKGLIIHSADEAGTAVGPDYRFGWGLANVKKASDILLGDSANHFIKELVLTNAQTITIPVTVATAGPLRATISWFDQPGPVNAAMPLNDRTPKLINDLDLRIVRLSDNTTTSPYKLDPANPANAATTGDNVLDNVEQVLVANAAPGNYEIRISHKGATLVTGRQSFGLLVSGVSSKYAGTLCHGLLRSSASRGTITDGSGSQNYKDNSDCTWQIDVQDTTAAVAINFTAMGLSAGDTVYLYSGTQTRNTLLGKYSGTAIPAGVKYGSKGRAYIRFVSDAATASTGFSLNYNIVTLPQVTVTSGSSQVCSGNAVRFIASTATASDTAGLTWQWNIPGAIPNNPTGRTPVVILPNGGTYTASVSATNLVGTANATIQTVVRALNGNIFSAAYAEERFDANTTWPRNTIDTNGTWRTTTSPASNTNWSRSTVAAYSGTASAYIRSNTVLVGTVRELISPNFNMTGLTTGQRLRFRIASARATANSSDIMKLFWSNNCGNTWTQISYNRSGTTNPSIYTVIGTRRFPFIPADGSEWRTESVIIPAAAIASTRCQFKWEYTNDASTSLYMDDIMVGDSALAVSIDKNLTTVHDLATAYPNPGEVSNAKLKINVPTGEALQICITDVVGRQQMLNYTVKQEGEVLLVNELFGNTLSTGLYNITIQREREVQQIKLVLQ